MTSPAFSSRSNCPLPFIPDIAPDLIQDCEIPPVPDPFFQAPVFPPIIPPITLGCPPISVSAVASKVMNKNSPLKFSASAHPYDPNGDECFPQIDLNIWVPFACPSMSAASVSPSVGPSPSCRLMIYKQMDNAPDCLFEFDLDILFPCTRFSVRSHEISRVNFFSAPSMSLGATPDYTNGCQLNFDIKIGIPALEDVDTACVTDGDFLVGGDLYVESNVLYFSCSKLPITTSTSITGSGGCVDYLSLSYAGSGSLVLELGLTSCSAVYC